MFTFLTSMINNDQCYIAKFAKSINQDHKLSLAITDTSVVLISSLRLVYYLMKIQSLNGKFKGRNQDRKFSRFEI